MLFSSNIFLFLFLPVVLLIYYALLKKRRARNNFLLGSSLVFYAWGEPWFVTIMMLSIIGNYIFGILANKHRSDKTRSRLVIIAMLLLNFSILFIFKYLSFTIANVSGLLGRSFSLPNLLLPIGISFFTFQAVSYVLDVYRKDTTVQKNIFDLGLYIALFPQLIAGPIVRYKTVATQIQERKETFDIFSEGVERFIIGFGKKVLLANNMAIVADAAFQTPIPGLSISFAWLGIVAYTFQIFFDFSGYSDMAIGLGRMFGFHFLENFNYPYIAKSVSDFWRRWHISLSSWFRDYVYFPLGGSRVGSDYRLLLNLFVVWSLTGLWHGANWTFLLWGMFYFVLLSVEKLFDFEKKYNGFVLLKRAYVVIAVMIGWVLFRSETLDLAWQYLRVMFGLSGQPFGDVNTVLYFNEYLVFFLFSVLFSTPFVPRIRRTLENKKGAAYFTPLLLSIIFLISISYIVKGAYNPFIYFNF